MRRIPRPVLISALLTLLLSALPATLVLGEEGPVAPGAQESVVAGPYEPMAGTDGLPDVEDAKLDSGLRIAYRLWRQDASTADAKAGAATGSRSGAALPALDKHFDVASGTGAGANVLVQTTDDAAALEAAGIQIQSRIGDVATAFVPFERLPELAALSSVLFMEASRQLEAANDAGVPASGAPSVWTGYGTAGANVVVGVLDSGVDPFHPDFMDESGKSRIRYMLDYSDPGDPDSDGSLNGPVGGGSEYTAAQVDAAAANPGYFFLGPTIYQAIPDNSTSGTSKDIAVNFPVTISSVAVDLAIWHSYVGDVKVTLRCPSGTSVILRNQTGGSRFDLEGTLTTGACNGQTGQGTWRVTVSDLAAGDTGTFNFWNLHLNRPVRITDQVGHGSHVLGSAAGNGLGTGNGIALGTYQGMAPAADLVVVRGTRNYVGSFGSADIVNGMAYIRDKASALNKPFVINLSLGGDIGPHDGSTLEERSIDNLVGAGKAGRAVVVAAGNSGGRHVHAGGQVPGGGTNEVSFYLASSSAVMDFWYEGSDTFKVGFFDPTGGGINPTTLLPGSDGCWSSANSVICIDSVGNDANNGDKHLFVYVDTLLTGTWRVVLHGQSVTNGRFDGYIAGTEFTSDVTDLGRVGMPGTARNAITVGAYNTKNQWIDVNGATRSITAPLGQFASFSSDGPTRDNRQKPEISAPGQIICSTYSAQSPAGAGGSIFPSANYVCRDGKHAMSQGTSMATPHVTGAVALLLGINKNLDAAQIKNHLTSKAKTDAFTGAVPNNRWGYGKLDVFASAKNIAAPSAKKRYMPVLYRAFHAAAAAPSLTPTATPTQTSTPVNGPSPTATATEVSGGWETLLTDGFETGFPGLWQVYDGNGPSFGSYTWSARNCRAASGSQSAWAGGGGADGGALACGANYMSNVDTAMVYGPFSLAGVTEAEVRFKRWLRTEEGVDELFWGASIDGQDYYGTSISGDWSAGWFEEVFDLTDVYMLGNVTGRPEVWLALAFYSDGTITSPEGAYLDDVLIRKRSGGLAAGGNAPSVAPPGATQQNASYSIDPIAE